MFNREKFLAENVNNFNLDAFVDNTNKAFSKANKARKRVLIAKDVILRIALNNLWIKEGEFICKSLFLNNLNDNSLSFKKVLNTNSNEIICKVCAKGALFCSVIGRINNMSIGDVRFTGNDIENINHKQLLKYFSIEQLDMIETAFERISFIHAILEEDREKCKDFYDNFSNSQERLIAICENIINNQGTFVL